jgi:hypothetical protein
MELAQRIWDWLPQRTDSRRVTWPTTIAVALDVAPLAVSQTLQAMETRGHAVRNQATGRQTGWHRGTPLAPAEREVPEQGLW